MGDGDISASPPRRCGPGLSCSKIISYKLDGPGVRGGDVSTSPPRGLRPGSSSSKVFVDKLDSPGV